MATADSAALRPGKSTNGRSIPRAPRPFRWAFGALQWIRPSAAERLAGWLFCHPFRACTAPEEKAIFEQSHPFRIRARGFELQAYSWGDGPTVLLHHGWNGRATHMAGLVRPLLDAGFSVVAYDAPAHGDSPGRITSAPEMARVLKEVASELCGIHAVVAHSIGGAATLLAVQAGLEIEKAVLLATPSDLRVFIDQFGEHLDLDSRTRSGMARRVAAWFGMEWDEMTVESWARRTRPPLLVVHDRYDRIVPWSHAAEICSTWKNAELLTTTGLGHRGVRRNPEIVARAVNFLRLPAARGV
jgi:pimeloyl-ACP methyl ester carboxylesterase